MSGESRLARGSNPGRNDRCPCGSGRKYKNCCGRPAATAPEELFSRRFHAAENEVALKALRFGDRLSPDLLPRAWERFTSRPAKPSDPDDDPDFKGAFLSWLLHNHPLEPALRGEPLPLALAYVRADPRAVDELGRRIVEATCGRPFSFYIVRLALPGHGLELRDVMTGVEGRVMERMGSRALQVGDVIWARTVPFDEHVFIVGCGSHAIPPRLHGTIFDLRDALAGAGQLLSAEGLTQAQDAIRSTYLELRDALLSPKLPELRNTQGHRLVPTTLRFALRCPPLEAYAALRVLGFEEDAADPASQHRSGPLEIDWLAPKRGRSRDESRTVKGGIEIREKRLVAHVNSAERARQLRREIERRLGDRVAFEAALIEPIEAALARPDRQRRSPPTSPIAPADLPDEIRERLTELGRRHHEKWLRSRIPALGGLTPRQAARDPRVRERLEALLLQLERDAAARPDDPFRADVGELRRRLGLEPR